MEEFSAHSILARLNPLLKEEGLEFQVVDVAEGVVHLRGRRVSAGAPMAFVVRALEGTFRRYLPGFREVALDEWQGLQEPPASCEPRIPGLRMSGLPALDLAGTDRQKAAQALEIFFGMLRRQGASCARLLGVAADGPERAVRKWLAVRREDGVLGHLEAGHRDRWILHFGQACEAAETCNPEESVETLPARILLLGQP
ncbi:MAG: hypothetical protein ACOX9B_12745 [Candidatus Xenobium sp.]|nr:hypothetical protein [Burkholderiales bacterium]